MRLAVIGCGYVGLVTSGCLAYVGHDVVAADNDARRIEILQAGGMPIHEPGLEVVLKGAHDAGHLRYTGDCGEAIASADAVFICVGTPPLESGAADLSAIDNVARLIATVSNSPKLVIEKSTVPAQTGEQLQRALTVYGRKGGTTFRVASNPEFLREGTAVGDFFHPDRIVVGVSDEVAERQLREIYKPLIEGTFRCPVHDGKCPHTPAPVFLTTTIASAELIKHASNSFLGLKISYANVISDLCERLGGNVEEVMRAIGLDPRIGGNFLNAGLGFGGFCLPKDIQAFLYLAERNGVDFGLLHEAEKVNQRRIDQFLQKVRRALWVVKDKQVGALGLAFKPNTDDVRFAPAIEVVKRLASEGAVVRASDPVANERARSVLKGTAVDLMADPYDVARGSDALLILTEWSEYRDLDWKRIHMEMARPLVIDGRNMLPQAQMRDLGFEYYSFGRPELYAQVPTY
jgi:UDPglucose 6-dehydrogenase